jgi:hypothetical protein
MGIIAKDVATLQVRKNMEKIIILETIPTLINWTQSIIKEILPCCVILPIS